MAHGNYHCCAICDTKMDYAGFEARTKGDVCGDCTKRGHEVTGQVMTNGQDLHAWLTDAPVEQINQLGIARCIYDNSIDKLVFERGGTFSHDPWRALTKRLQAEAKAEEGTS